MDASKIKNFKRRIVKASRSFSIGTDMFLTMDIDRMGGEARRALQAGLLQGKTPVRYAYLDKKVALDEVANKANWAALNAWAGVKG